MKNLLRHWWSKVVATPPASDISPIWRANQRRKELKELNFAGFSASDIAELKAKADNGDAEAQAKLGDCYFYGNGVPQNQVEAAKWFWKAAEQGNVVGQFFVGQLYAQGLGVPKDAGRAFGWYRKAAEQGYARAQFNLGVCYDEGSGVPQDYAEAAKWYRRAADQNFAPAQFNLGKMCEKGIGVMQDYTAAVDWLRKAAEQDFAPAQNALGRLLATGDGVAHMKPTLSLIFALTCVLLCGCASPHFTPYVGEQGWPQSPGSTVETNCIVPIYHGWPDKPYTVLGVITTEGNHPAAVARCAKSKGADALIYRTTLTGNAGTYTTPGHATSITSGNFAYGQYSGFTTTTYSPGISAPLIVTVTVYNAIKWEDPLQTEVGILRNSLDWLNAHPDGGTMGEGQDATYFSAEQVQKAKIANQKDLDDLLSPLNPSQAQAKVDKLRSTLDWVNAHPDDATHSEGQVFSAEDVQGMKNSLQRELDAWLFRLNQFTKTNASANSVISSQVLAQTPQTNASGTLDSEKLKTLKPVEAAAEEGDPLCQGLLAVYYGVGSGGVQKDSAKAAYWCLRAAKQGADGSQFSMGEMYEKGEGVMQDFIEAYKWFNIAAVAPDIDWNTATNFFKLKDVEVLKKSWVPVAEKAKAARDQLARQMTPEQIAEGQRRSAAFVPRKETPSSNSQSASPAAADSPLRFTPPPLNSKEIPKPQ